jgi:hypothetical protein
MECARFDEFDACADALLSWEIEAVQLDRGPFVGELVVSRRPFSRFLGRRVDRRISLRIPRT